MRYINTSISRIINLDEYQQVMFMYNVISFADDSNLSKLILTKQKLKVAVDFLKLHKALDDGNDGYLS